MLKPYVKTRALLATRDRGVTAVEYALIIAAVAVVIGATVFFLGSQIREAFFDSCKAVNNGGATGCGSAPSAG